jgi:hypothetical protein
MTMSTSPSTAESQPSTVIRWLWNIPLRNAIIAAGAKAFAIGAGLSLVLALLTAVALISGAAFVASAIFPGSQGGLPLPSSGPSSNSALPMDVVTSAFTSVLGFFFFEANLAPYQGAYGPATVSLFGVGSLGITALIARYAFISGRRLSLRFQDPTLTAATAALRASMVAVPYWALSIILFILGSHTLAYQGQTIGSLGPSPVALITPLLLVGAFAATGGAWPYRKATSHTGREILRGASFGVLSILTGVIGTVVGAVLGVIIGALSGSGPKNPIPSNPSSSSSPTGNAGFFVVAAVAGLIVLACYLLNGLFLLWGSNVGLKLMSSGSAFGILVPLLGLIGAALPALHLRRSASYVEQVSFAVAFGGLTALLTLLAEPAAGVTSVGPSLGVVLLVGLGLGAALAFAGPIAGATTFGQVICAHPLMRRLEWAGSAIAAGSAGTMTEIPMSHSPGEGTLEEHTVSPGAVVLMPMPSIHLGRRAKVAAAAVVVLVALGIAGNVVLGNLSSPEAVASDYVSAVGANNADAIWSDSTFHGTTTGSLFGGPAPFVLANKDELAAMLSLPQNRHFGRDSIQATKVLDDRSGNVQVSVRYNENGRASADSLTLARDPVSKKFGFYPYWRVVLPLGLVDLSGQLPGASVAVDGIGVPQATTLVATITGAHKVSIGATSVFAADTETVMVTTAQPAPANFKVNLTAAATAQAVTLVKSAFADCTKVTTLQPQNCPQNVSTYGAQEPVAWTLVGDPTSDLKLGLSTNGQTPSVAGTGHFMMTVAYNDSNTPPRASHRFSGGAYGVTFDVSGETLSLSGLSAGGFSFAPAADLPPPTSATDAAIITAVSAAFQACAKATTIDGSNDCPNRAYAYNPTNVKWSVVSEPTAGSKVTWDGQSGSYTVTGDFAMTATFNDGFSGGSSTVQSKGGYTAHVLWINGAAQVVWID